MEHQYHKPVDRVIQSEQHIERWHNSKSFDKLIAFITRCSDAVKGKRISECAQGSAIVGRVLAMLQTMESWLEEFPPIPQPQRFGNKAFRQWYDKVAANALPLCEAVLPEDKKGAAIELAVYLEGCIGNSTRLDYGTGHETAFVVLLLVLDELKLFAPDDYQCVPLKLFAAYLKLVRAFQRRYMLEPAGSHGVWSLDDYQFLPFLFGSAQLCNQNTIKPRQVLNQETVKQLKDEYLYFAAIDYIFVTKAGPFFEHSPVLFDISNVATWDKINGGMFKMYKVEVLGKVPIMQHLAFGSLFVSPLQ